MDTNLFAPYTLNKRFWYILLVAILMTIFAGCASKAPLPDKPLPTHAGSDQTPGSYIVKKGDTLYRIARAHHVSVSQLKQINRIKNPKNLQAGTRITIPKRSTDTISKSKKNRIKSDNPDFKVLQASIPGYLSDITPSGPYSPSTDFIWPVKKIRISSKYGRRSKTRYHRGLDLSAPKGTPIYAVADGVVISASKKCRRGYGRLIKIQHDAKTITYYAHANQIYVKTGQKVKKGQVIATVGRTGNATGCHLHFEVRKNNRPVNPLKYLPQHT